MYNKQDIVKRMSKRIGKSQKEVKEVIDAYIDEILMALAEGEEVKIPGIVKLIFKETPKTKRFCNLTKKEITIRPKKTVKVKPLSNVKEIDLLK